MKPSPACPHHWRIAEPAGAYSRGVCSACGAERAFANGQHDKANDFRVKGSAKRDFAARRAS